ncbi:MAG: hypothetical protein ACLFQB_15450 [Chitinispirillaceae bacterium]
MDENRSTMVTVEKVVEAGPEHILMHNSDKKLWIADRLGSGKTGQPQFLLDDVFYFTYSGDSIAVLLESGEKQVGNLNEIKRRLENRWNPSEAFRSS